MCGRITTIQEQHVLVFSGVNGAALRVKRNRKIILLGFKIKTKTDYLRGKVVISEGGSLADDL